MKLSLAIAGAVAAAASLIAGATRPTLYPFEESRQAYPGIDFSTHTFAIKGADTLRLDVYIDPTVEMPGPKPILFYLYGGGWEAGARKGYVNDLFGHLPYFANQGFVVVSGEYRLGFLRARKSGEIADKGIIQYMAEDSLVDSSVWPAVVRSVDIAVEDFLDATRYVAEHAAQWGADPTKIVATGGSAGAITVLTAEHRIANRDADALARLPEGFNFAGVIPMAGGVWTASTDSLQWATNPCPLMMFHGDADPIVPYSTRRFGCGTQWGVKEIATQCRRMGVPYALYTVAGGDHAMANNPLLYNGADVVQWVRRVVIDGEPMTLDVTESTTSERYTRDGYWFDRWMKAHKPAPSTPADY